MGRQLTLLSPSKRPEWKLDETTKQVGRKGVAEVRKILRQTAPAPKTAA